MVEAVPSVIESPKATITCVSAGAIMSTRVEEEPGGGRERERRLVLAVPFGAGAGRGDIGGLQRLGVPGHRPALARDVEADRELAAGKLALASRTKGSATAIAPHALAGLDR